MIQHMDLIKQLLNWYTIIRLPLSKYLIKNACLIVTA